MSQRVNITIEKNHSQMITTTITGMDDWAGLYAKLYVVKDYGSTPDIDIDGSIISDSTSDRVVFYVPPTATENLEAGVYHYEIALFDASHTYIRNTNHGDCTITPTISDLL